MGNAWKLVWKEIRYRRLDAFLGIVAVCVAVGCLVAVMTLLRGHDLRMAELTGAQEEETLALMRQVEDDYRVITKKLGYNLLLVDKDQDLAEFYAQGYASVLMPEDYVDRLANAESMTVRHLLPTLHQKIEWAEAGDLPVILVGVRGEAHQSHVPGRDTLMDPIQPGTVALGAVLHEKLGKGVGDTVRLLGRDFTVARVHAARGNSDDITVWLHLAEAQEMLGRQGRVNAIMALSCVCAEGELDTVRQEMAKLLPETQVIMLASQAQVRTEARTRAADLNQTTAGDQAAYHARLREEREALAAWLVPLVIAGCAVWVGLLAFGNVRDRTVEIGILRALGYRSTQILGIFLGKALLLGLVGAVLGYAAGLGLGLGWGRWEGVPLATQGAAAFLNIRLLAAVLIGAPLLAITASWIPAMLAAQQDPAVVLREG